MALVLEQGGSTARAVSVVDLVIMNGQIQNAARITRRASLFMILCAAATNVVRMEPVGQFKEPKL